jgi:hypothetical protein
MELLGRLLARFLAIGFLALPTPEARAAAAAPSEVHVATDYARVSGDPNAQEVIGRVARAMDRAVPRIASLVGTTDVRPIVAHVYVHRGRFREATGIPQGSPVVGLASLPAGVIHIDGTGVLASIRKVVPHEVGHVMIARALGPALPALPTWLNEGTAEYVAGERAAQVDPVALRAVGRGMAMEFTELDAAIETRGRDAGLAYAQAASLVNFLVDRRGEAVIADLLTELRRTGDLEASLQQATGFTLDEMESTWRESVSRRWRWPLILTSPAPILGLMLLLFLIGVVRFYVAKRRRQQMPDYDW